MKKYEYIINKVPTVKCRLGKKCLFFEKTLLSTHLCNITSPKKYDTLRMVITANLILLFLFFNSM
jgi:hypothetical protein